MSVDDEFDGHRLPEFPVDDGTLDLLWLAMHPGPEAESSSVGNFLEFMAEMGGSDPRAVAEVVLGDDEFTPAAYIMRDQGYHDHDVMSALVVEIRRLRKGIREVIADCDEIGTNLWDVQRALRPLLPESEAKP